MIPGRGGAPEVVTMEAVVHENVIPEVVKRGSVELRQDLLGRDYKGKNSKGIAKKTSALIQKLQPTLTKFLDAGEQVLYIARVQRHASGLIQYTMGWYIYYASATVIVLTDRRLLHLRVTNSNQWDKGVRTCLWSELESASVGGWALGRVLKLEFRNGTKYRYWRISRADALNMKKILTQLLSTHQGTPYKAQSLVSLCPECKRELTLAASTCSGCGITFKAKKTMYWLSGAICGIPLYAPLVSGFRRLRDSELRIRHSGHRGVRLSWRDTWLEGRRWQIDVDQRRRGPSACRPLCLSLGRDYYHSPQQLLH